MDQRDARHQARILDALFGDPVAEALDQHCRKCDELVTKPEDVALLGTVEDPRPTCVTCHRAPGRRYLQSLMREARLKGKGLVTCPVCRTSQPADEVREWNGHEGGAMCLDCAGGGRAA